MNKKQIKSIYKNRRYFDHKTNQPNKQFEMMYILSQAAAVDPDRADRELDKMGQLKIHKERERLEREALIMTRLQTIWLIRQQPTTLDIIENPTQSITQQQIILNITSSQNSGIPTIVLGRFSYATMSKEEFGIYSEVYDELTKGEKKSKVIDHVKVEEIVKKELEDVTKEPEESSQ